MAHYSDMHGVWDFSSSSTCLFKLVLLPDFFTSFVALSKLCPSFEAKMLDMACWCSTGVRSYLLTPSLDLWSVNSLRIFRHTSLEHHGCTRGSQAMVALAIHLGFVTCCLHHGTQQVPSNRLFGKADVSYRCARQWA